MGKKRKHLSHEEIWDDSALVDSWDLALQEYQVSNHELDVVGHWLTFSSCIIAFMPAEKESKMFSEKSRVPKTCQRMRKQIWTT